MWRSESGEERIREGGRRHCRRSVRQNVCEESEGIEGEINEGGETEISVYQPTVVMIGESLFYNFYLYIVLLLLLLLLSIFDHLKF